MIRPSWQPQSGTDKSAQPLRGYTATASAARGYTLLELLIVGVLVTVLMAGVWSLFRNWGGLYARGEQRVQRLQLVRSLCDQLADDVHAAAQVVSTPAHRDASQASPSVLAQPVPVAPAGNSALVGGSDWLILEVVQPANPWQSQATEQANDMHLHGTPDPAQRVGLIAPELRRVVYTFAPPESDVGDGLSFLVDEMAAADDTELVAGEDAQEPPFAGLLRLAVAYESPLVSSQSVANAAGAMSAGSRDTAFRMRAAVVGGDSAADYDVLSPVISAPTGEFASGSSATTQSDTDPLAGILERDEVAEVVSFELRYYDGSSWQSSWDSQARGRLPVAVEMRFELQVADPAAERPVRSEDGERELVDTSPPSLSSSGAAAAGTLGEDSAGMSLSSDETAALSGGESVETPYYRCVVCLGAKEEQP